MGKLHKTIVIPLLVILLGIAVFGFIDYRSKETVSVIQKTSSSQNQPAGGTYLEIQEDRSELNTGGIGHVLVDDLADAEGGRDLSSESRPADIAIDGPFRRLPRVEPDGAAGEIVGIELAEDEVGVGDRRAVAAATVAGGSGLGPGTLRSGLDPSHRVDPGDRAATGPDLDHLDDRDRDRHAEPLRKR